MSPRHRDALAHLLYGVGSGGGFILLTGEVGTGKTTINRALLEQLPDNTDLAIVLNPALSAPELLATVCDEFEIDYPQGTDSLKLLTDALHAFLLANHSAGRRSVLMIDEAQHLDFDVLEQIRLLTNLETDSEKLLQIILIGQPELTEKLARPELRQLNQRITARYDLKPLTLDETQAYIRHRLEVAGLAGGRELFPRAVVAEIHRRTQGIPRQINLLCDRTLLGAYGRKKQRLNRKLVRSAAAEVFGSDEAKRWGRRLGLVAAGALALLVVVAVIRGVLAPSPVEVADTMPPPSPVQPEVAVTEEASTGDADGEIPQLLSVEQGGKWLWQLYSDAPQPLVPCPEAVVAGLQCVRERADVWEPLIALNRPLLLDMQTPGKFSATTLVVGFEARSAWVMTRTGVERFSLLELAAAWRGSYRYFWQPPVGWSGPLEPESELALPDADAAASSSSAGPSNRALIASVARSFATLDGQQQALSDGRFNAVLTERVKLFQQGQGLEVSGVVDIRTWLKLNEALGLAPDNATYMSRARLLTGGN